MSMVLAVIQVSMCRRHMGFCTELFLVTSGPASAERAIAPVISRSGLISSGGSLLVPPKPTQPANWIRNVKPTVFR